MKQGGWKNETWQVSEENLALIMDGFLRERSCAAAEQIVELRLALRYLGVRALDKSHLFGDNKSVADSSTVPHSKLNKCHNMLCCHRVREAWCDDCH